MTPKRKLILAVLLLAGLAVSASLPLQGASAAKSMGALFALIAVGVAVLKVRGQSAELKLPPRLRVLSQAGLSAKCSLALVEADGRTFLVAFGDGYAELCEPSPARPPRSKR